MTTTETIDAILAACRKCVELGEKATPRPWNAFIAEKIIAIDNKEKNVVGWSGFDSSDAMPKEQKSNAAFIAHACNIGVAACKSLILAIEALRSMSTDSISADAAEACEHPIDAAKALESIAHAWEGAV